MVLEDARGVELVVSDSTSSLKINNITNVRELCRFGLSIPTSWTKFNGSDSRKFDDLCPDKRPQRECRDSGQSWYRYMQTSCLRLGTGLGTPQHAWQIQAGLNQSLVGTAHLIISSQSSCPLPASCQEYYFYVRPPPLEVVSMESFI